MARRSFKGYRSDTPVEFDLESPDGTKKLTVRCKASIPGFVLLDFMSKADVENPGTMAQTITTLIKSAVDPEQWPEVEAFIRDEANGIDLELLGEVAGYIAEAYGGRGNPQSPALSPVSS